MASSSATRTATVGATRAAVIAELANWAVNRARKGLDIDALSRATKALTNYRLMLVEANVSAREAMID